MKRLKKVSELEVNLESIPKKDIVSAFFLAAEYEFRFINDEDFLYEYQMIEAEGNKSVIKNNLDNLIVNFYIKQGDISYLYDKLEDSLGYKLDGNQNDNYIKEVIKNYYNYTNMSPYEQLNESIQEAINN